MSDAPSKRPAYEPATRLLRPTVYDPDMARPAATIAGTVLVLLRVVAGALVLVGLAAGWSDLVTEAGLVGGSGGLTAEEAQVGLQVILIAGALVLLVDLLLAWFIFRGGNWARMLMMIVTTLSISGSFVAWWWQGQEISLQGTFLSLSIDILILLALSSRTAAAFARRNERR